jgi:thiamine-monophosphate kinase
MEREFIRWLREHVPKHSAAPLGFSDDAAIVSLPGQSEIVVTTDLLTDGVDFRLGFHEPERIGRQSLGVNLSDMAAMAARPLAAVIALALPKALPEETSPLNLAIKLYEGLLPLAREFDLAIAGGDTNTYEGPLVISATVLGELNDRGPLTRARGQPGDWLLVTGALGGSILGHMLDFTPRVREAIAMHERYQLHAGLDISDGLALDASRLATESGCGAVIYSHRVPVSAAAHELSRQDPDSAALDAEGLKAAALRHALGDGQDFELLLAAPPDVAERIVREQPVACGITHVGELVEEAGLWQQGPDGNRSPLEPVGWLHS